MKRMITDLIIHFPDNKPEAGYTIYIGIFADDGAVIQVRIRHFDVPFEAKNIEKDVETWLTWRIGSHEELEEYRRRRDLSKKVTG